MLRFLTKTFGVMSITLCLCSCSYISSTFTSITGTSKAEKITLGSLFQNGMVLQRGMDVPVWGWCEPGREVTVKILTQKVTTIADNTGRWEIRLAPMKSCGPIKMTVSGKESIVIEDVMIGEVWICSGQSNMQWSLNQAKAEKTIRRAKNSRIRLFKVKLKSTETPQTSCEGKWERLTPQAAKNFSAVGYYFGKDIYKDLAGVPVGLIQVAWGGTVIQAWMDMNVMGKLPAAEPYLIRYNDVLKNFSENQKDYEFQRELFKQLKNSGAPAEKGKKAVDPLASRPTRHTDPGNFGYDKGWAAVECSMKDWKEVDLPNKIEVFGDIDGAVWFRRDLQLPESWAGHKLIVELGPIDDFDTTYFNNTKIGSIGQETSHYWETPRKYTIPGKLVKKDHNVIAVRVFDNYSGGGFMGNSKSMKIYPARDPDAFISLDGMWFAKIEHKLYPFMLKGGRVKPPFGPGHRNAPAGLRNAMINPLIPYAIRGVIWYQGESNTHEPAAYRALLPEMINDWRAAWENDFTFLIVQLANFKQQWPIPQESNWAELREAQMMAATLPKVGVAVTIDIGEANNIHPGNKDKVGNRLARLAAQIAYGKKTFHGKLEPPAGPVFESMKVEKGKVYIKFKNAEHGLISKDGKPLRHFSIAGKDGKFVWAKAEIFGKGKIRDTVVVWTPLVPNPENVRYAWADNPYACNLYNHEELPAAPFRTDKPEK